MSCHEPHLSWDGMSCHEPHLSCTTCQGAHCIRTSNPYHVYYHARAYWRLVSTEQKIDSQHIAGAKDKSGLCVCQRASIYLCGLCVKEPQSICAGCVSKSLNPSVRAVCQRASIYLCGLCVKEPQSTSIYLCKTGRISSGVCAMRRRTLGPA